VADYEGDPVEMSDAQELVEKAETFVAAMRAEFMPAHSDENDERMTPKSPERKDDANQ
jgi:hypothetical protein